MFFSLSLALTALSAVPFVAAHGVVSSIQIDGQNFPGNLPGAPPKGSIIRQISDASPVKGATNPAVNCGPGAPNAQFFAKVNPGSTIKFDWTAGSMEPWPHNTGPMLTYLASCGDVTCDQFDARNAKWFKIQQVGRTAKGGPWAQAALMNGATADITMPTNIRPGNYLIRHEIIALHLANQQGGAEFYPSCAQIQITGSGTGFPKDSETVKFPGGYSDNDPGIFIQNAFDVNADYPFPGPAIAAFVNGGESGPAPVGNSAATSTKDGKPKPTSTGAGTPGSTAGAVPVNNAATGGSCKLVPKKRSTVVHRPRHLSRIMRGLDLHNSH